MKTSNHSPRTQTRHGDATDIDPCDWNATATERQMKHLNSFGLDPHPDESIGSAARRINRVFSLRRESEHRALRAEERNYRNYRDNHENH